MEANMNSLIGNKKCPLLNKYCVWQLFCVFSLDVAVSL